MLHRVLQLNMWTEQKDVATCSSWQIMVWRAVTKNTQLFSITACFGGQLVKGKNACNHAIFRFHIYSKIISILHMLHWTYWNHCHKMLQRISTKNNPKLCNCRKVLWWLHVDIRIWTWKCKQQTSKLVTDGEKHSFSLEHNWGWGGALKKSDTLVHFENTHEFRVMEESTTKVHFITFPKISVLMDLATILYR